MTPWGSWLTCEESDASTADGNDIAHHDTIDKHHRHGLDVVPGTLMEKIFGDARADRHWFAAARCDRGRIDRLQSDGRGILAIASHDLQTRAGRYLPVARKRFEFVLARRSLPDFDFQVSAKQFLPAIFELVVDG
ncbi:hypothetical protein AB1L30_00095 [Bremerella sp. JC817]|uniref:hypothetical protein n=1 Tax=Bremerella sp. JC817 TaxID=3231756 RepID=UPI00345A76B5